MSTSPAVPLPPGPVVRRREGLLRFVLIVSTTVLVFPGALLTARNGRPDLAVGIAAMGFGVLSTCLRIGRPPLRDRLARRIDLASVLPYALAMLLPGLAQLRFGPVPSAVTGIVDGIAFGCGLCCFLANLLVSRGNRVVVPDDEDIPSAAIHVP